MSMCTGISCSPGVGRGVERVVDYIIGTVFCIGNYTVVSRMVLKFRDLLIYSECTGSLQVFC